METTKNSNIELQQPLTRENAHRVLSIRPKDAPDNFPEAVQFHFRGKKLGMNTYQHLIGNIKNSVILAEKDFLAWLIVEVKHPGYLEEFWQKAHDAYRLTSFEPEERGETAILTYEAELHNDLQSIPEAERERYTDNYKKYFSAMLSSHANCASTMITGPAGFNHKRNEKANNTYNRRYSEFRTWRERALVAIARHAEDAKPDEQKQQEAWLRLRKEIISSASTIHAINTGQERGYNKALFVSSIYGKVATFADHGQVEIVRKAVELIRELNTKGKKAIITERHSFFRLQELAENKQQKAVALSGKENKEITFDCGRIVLNYREDRLQIFFDKIPDADLRIALKRKHAFNWSPSNKAWQRKLTGNALDAARRTLGLQTA